MDPVVEPVRFAARRRSPDLVGRGLRIAPELRLAGAKSSLRGPPLSDVAENRGHKNLGFAYPPRKRHFEIANRAILAPSNDVQRLMKRKTLRNRTQRGVPRSRVLRQRTRWPPYQLLRGITELTQGGGLAS